jgi:AcrR family transcriptional regulator
MAAIVAERGYEAVTLRELAGLAGVSTRAFYQHYSSKDDCFLDVHRLAVSRLLNDIEASQAGVRERDERTRRGLTMLVQRWTREPDTARLVLVDAYAAGPTALKKARRAEGWIAWRVGVDLAVVSGLVSVVRSRLLENRGHELAGLAGELISWAFTCLEDLRSDRPEPLPRDSENRPRRTVDLDLVPTCDLALLLSAAVKLAVTEGRSKATVDRIATAAGVSRKSFYSHFSGPEDCFLMALESRVRAAIDGADRADEGAPTAAHMTCGAVASFSARITRDPVFAALGFAEIEAFGVSGLLAQARLLHGLSELIAKRMSLQASPVEPSLYASAGALWSVLAREIENARPQSLIGDGPHETVRCCGKSEIATQISRNQLRGNKE